MPTKAILRPNVVVEPLFQSWYAWPHLISPGTAAMNVAHRHLSIMESFVRAPHLHRRMLADPRMIGGPFMDHGRERVAEVAALLEETKREQAPLLRLAQAIGELNELLRREARGASLDPFYARIPEELRGLVELVYDLNHVPAFRLLEELLYRSELYDTRYQSLAVRVDETEERAFILSTPRLRDPSNLRLDVPFAAPALDRLFAARRQPSSPAELADALGVAQEHKPLFQSLFRKAPTGGPRPRGEPPEGLSARYFGHGCLLLEARGVSLLSDPAVSYPFRGGIPRYTLDDLPERIDYVLLTHNHQDHVLLETLLQIRHKVGRVVVPANDGGSLQDPSLRLALRAIGFSDVVQLEPLESLEDERGVVVTGIPFLGEHSDLAIRSKICFHVSDGPRSVLLAADSRNVDPCLYRRIHAVTGDVDLLFLGMECDGAPLSWLYGPLLGTRLEREDDHSRRLAGCDFEEARELVRALRPSGVYVYAMGQEPWLGHIMSLVYTPESLPIVASDRLVEACRAEGLSSKRLYGREHLVLEGGGGARRARVRCLTSGPAAVLLGPRA